LKQAKTVDLVVFIAEDGSIIVNKALAKRANVTTTARHEWLHKIILAAVNSNSEGAKKIGSDLMAFLESELGKSIKGDATRRFKRFRSIQNQELLNKLQELKPETLTLKIG
jgi:hypothetical protein